jgi:hypothetical protein
MLLRLLTPFFFAGCSFVCVAQCPSSYTSPESDVGTSTSESISDGSSGGGFGENDSRFRLGYGQRYLLHNYATILSANGTRLPVDNSWLGSRPAHVFDFSWGLGVRDNWRLGTAFSTQRLQSETTRQHFDPPTSADSMRALDMRLDKTARLYSQTAYAEYGFLKLANNQLRLFARADIGATYYGARAAISYTDTCGCDQQPVVENTGSFVMTGSASLGMQFEYKAFGIKALAGYQLQTTNSFITKGQLADWKAHFRTEGYTYNGAPSGERFSITDMESERVNSRNNQLFLQVSLYVFFGRHY